MVPLCWDVVLKCKAHKASTSCSLGREMLTFTSPRQLINKTKEVGSQLESLISDQVFWGFLPSNTCKANIAWKLNLWQKHLLGPRKSQQVVAVCTPNSDAVLLVVKWSFFFLLFFYCMSQVHSEWKVKSLQFVNKSVQTNQQCSVWKCHLFVQHYRSGQWASLVLAVHTLFLSSGIKDKPKKHEGAIGNVSKIWLFLCLLLCQCDIWRPH